MQRGVWGMMSGMESAIGLGWLGGEEEEDGDKGLWREVREEGGHMV